jgi:hypothetical protein
MQLRSKNPAASHSIWLKTLALINLTILSFLFSSCSDDTVSPPKPPVSEFDSARFNWRTENIYYRGFAGAWAIDTNHIFLLNHANRNLYIVSGGNTAIYYAGDYYFNEIKGISNSEVYLFGAGLYDNKLTIIKWNGSSFETHATNTIVRNTRFIRGCAISSNEVWICSNNGISKFDGVNMTNYVYEDSLLDPDFFFLSVDNKLQYIAAKALDSVDVQACLFELRDTAFVRIFNDTIIPYPDRSSTFLEVIGGYKYGLKLNEPLGSPWSVCLQYFTGSAFMDYFCFNNKIENLHIATSANPVGLNLQSFIFLVHTDRSLFGSNVGIIHWNGEKPSKELMVLPYESPYYYDTFILCCINSDNYLVLEPDGYNPDNTWLHIGTKK